MSKPIHGEPKPQNVPSDMQPTSSLPFAVGDVVEYTNDCGSKWKARVRGFTAKPTSYGGEVYLEFWSEQGWRLGAWWFANRPDSIKKI